MLKNITKNSIKLLSLLACIIICGCSNENSDTIISNYTSHSILQLPNVATTISKSKSTAEFLYAVDEANNTIAMYLIESTGVLSSLSTPYIKTGRGPWSITISPDGQHAYVPCANDNSIAIYRIDHKNGILVWQNTDYNIGHGVQPHHITITPDGKSGYISAYNNKQIIVVQIDKTNGALLNQASIPTKQHYPNNLVLSSDGNHLYVDYNYAVSGVIDINPNIETFKLNRDGTLTSLGLSGDGYNN